MATVKETLQGQYGIEVKGSRTTCPFCHKNTFTIKNDDFGKCWHPNCGQIIKGQGKAEKPRCEDARWALSQILHMALMDTDGPPSDAWKYLTQEREISRCVVEDSLIGVVPKSIDIASLYEPVLSANKNETAIQGAINEEVEALEKLFAGRAGWIVFPYFDSRGNVVYLNLRKPFAKQFAAKSIPFSGRGLFGVELLQEDAQDPNSPMVVVEGEMNLLRLQSVAQAHTGAYVRAVSVGSASGPDVQAVENVATGKIHVIRDNDSAGQGMVKSLAKKLYLTWATTADPVNDIDELFSQHTDVADQWRAYEELLAPQGRANPEVKAVADKIDVARQGKRQASHTAKQEVSAIVLKDLAWHGEFLLAPDGPYYCNARKIVTSLDDKSLELQRLLSAYKLNPSEVVYKYLLFEMQTFSLIEGREAQTYRYNHYCREANAVYIYNGPGSIIRIDESGPSIMDNGTDGILLMAPTDATGFTLLPTRPEEDLLQKLLLEQINFSPSSAFNASDARGLFGIWLLATFFKSIMPTRPIVLFLGEKGSGKSTGLRLAGMVLHGGAFNVTSTPSQEGDFDVVASQAHLLVLDNVDSTQRWLVDKLAIISTGGSSRKRTLYLNDAVWEMRFTCFLGLTSRTPQFGRDDLAERMLIFNLDRMASYRAEHELHDEILKNRDAIMTEVCWKIADALKRLKQAVPVNVGRFRMADFASFAVRVAKDPETILKALSATETLQADLTLLRDPMVDLLTIWSERDAKRGKAREVSAPVLFAELKEISSDEDINFRYSSARSFAQKLKSIARELSSYFDMTWRDIGGNERVWKIEPKTGEKGVKGDADISP